MRLNFKARLNSWSAAWREFRTKLAPQCDYCGRVYSARAWRSPARRPGGVLMQGARYCGTECLELALREALGRERPLSRRSMAAPHRIPLGLILLSRRQLTAEQLREALAAQRAAGRGKIGEWLEELGFITEQEVTAALARQWSCPVLRPATTAIGVGRLPPIPLLLLDAFQMMPVEVVAKRTLLVAFSEGVDYTMLYAIEQMLGYRTEACLVSSTVLRRSLEALARDRNSTDVVFERMEDAHECARIIANYSDKVGADEVRLARCGDHLWVRLERIERDGVNMVLCQQASSQLSA
jgi:hypothetical protein